MSTTWIDSRPNAITLDEAKTHLRVDSNSEDSLISSLISAGTHYIEGVTGRAMVSGTLEYQRSDLPSTIPLPFSPVQSVVSIDVLDSNGATTTLDQNAYQLDTTRVPHRLIRNPTSTLPSLTLAVADPVTITVVAGYGDPSQVPETLKAAHKLFVSNFFENREPVVVGTIATAIPFSIAALLAPFKIQIEEDEPRWFPSHERGCIRW